MEGRSHSGTQEPASIASEQSAANTDRDYVNEGCIGDSDDIKPAHVSFSTCGSEPSLSRCSSARSLVTFVQCSESDKPTSDDEDVTSAMNAETADSLGSRWTDDKHSSYLSSMEETFVKNMYDREYCALSLCGQAPDHVGFEDQNSAESQLKLVFQSTEFIYCRQGDWRPMVFGQKLSPLRTARAVLANPWVKHFRPQAFRSPDLAGRNTNPVSSSPNSPNIEKVEKAASGEDPDMPCAHSSEMVPVVEHVSGMWQERLHSPHFPSKNKPDFERKKDSPNCAVDDDTEASNRKRDLQPASKQRSFVKQKMSNAFQNE